MPTAFRVSACSIANTKAVPWRSWFCCRATGAARMRRPRVRSDLEASRRGEHGRAAGVDGVDDLGVVDALEVDRGDPEVRVAELALDDVQRHTLARHLDRVSVTQLM